MNFETTNVGLSLIASPEAYMDESPVSWIQYICAEHQYSLTRLAKIVGFEPAGKDWDLAVSHAQWEIVLKMSGATSTACAEAREVFSRCPNSWESKTRTRRAGKFPVYQWCTHCFAGDRRPYLRWWWRAEISGYCQKHAIPLSHKCEYCGEPLRLSRALLVGGSARWPLPDLSHCQGCGMRLLDYPGTSTQTRLSLESRKQTFCVAPKNALSANSSTLYRYGHEIYLSTPDAVCTAIEKQIHPDRYVLNLTSATFQVVGSGKSPTLQNLHWSNKISRISTKSRQKLAYAIRLIRQEKRLSSAADHSPFARWNLENHHGKKKV